MRNTREGVSLAVLAALLAMFWGCNADDVTPPDGAASTSPADGGDAGRGPCASATRVTPGATLRGESTEGASVTTFVCQSDYRGGLRFYSVDIPAGQLLEVTASSDPTAPVAVRIFERCDGACLAASVRTARWFNASLAPQTVVVAVGGRGGDPVTFDVSFSTRAVAAGETCAAPIEVSSTAHIVVDPGPAGVPAQLCDRSMGRARWFRVSLPAGAGFTVRSTDAPGVRLRASDACDALTCLASGAMTLTLPRISAARTVLVSASPDGDSGFTLDFTLDTTPVPGVCVSSTVVRTSTTLSGESLNNVGESATDCMSSSHPSAFYRVVMAAGQRLTASISVPGSPFAPDILLRVLTSCRASACLAAPSPTSGPVPRVVYVNSTGAEQTVVVAVSARYTPTTTTTYTLALALDRAPPSASCATAPLVAAGAAVMGSSDDALELATQCGTTSARALFYAVDVPARRRLTVVSLPGTNASVLAACGSTTCLGTSWSGDPFPPSRSVAWTSSDAAARVIVALSPSFDFMSSTLGATLSLASPAPEEACATAPTLAAGTTLTDLTTRSSAQNFSGCSSSDGMQAALWWRVVVPAGRRLVASQRFTGTGSGTMSLAVVGACDATTCLASSAAFFSTSEPRVLAWTNTGVEERAVYLVASGASATFELAVSLEAPVGNASCATATALTAARTVSGQRFVDAGETVTLCYATAASLPALFYRVTVPAGQRLDVSVTSGGAGHVTRILDGCGATCLGVASVGSSSGTSVARWSNTGPVARDVTIAVSRADPEHGLAGVFDLTASLVAAPSNARCATPMPLTDGMTVSDRIESGVDAVTTCDSEARPALYYQVAVPAGQRLIARLVGPAGSFAGPVARILADCGATSCLGDTASYDGVAWWTNTGASARTVVVAVGPRWAGSSGPFSLTAALETPATNGRCASAARVEGAMTLRAGAFADADESPPVCEFTLGPSLFYRVSIPASRRFVVRLMPGGSSSLAFVSLLSDCAPSSCVDDGLARPSFPGVVRWTNAGSAARDVIVAVNASAGGGASPFSATVDLGFAVEAIPDAGACATAATLTSGASGVVSWSDAGEAAPTCGLSRASLPSLFYAVDVPPGQLLTATLSGAYVSDAGLRILGGCASPVCLAPWSRSSGSSTLSQTWRNTGAASQRAYVVASMTSSFGADSTAALTTTLSR